ncbi:hypothetical protein [Alkalihalobacillus trypoxylicola]|uniref:CMP-binding protein n=1 Tax=Alkalihalobacillus trypoxylicola TaxID=519424 RepID=A0A162EAT6_9BACI|nr:hypothetical protein [Alkalihalobacillus trypoxylicola]KYG32176.1 CMP-binding protein [Alkalihalobacillus trypoxylicola]
MTLANLKEGDTFTGFFLVREKEIKSAVNGSEYGHFLLERHLEKIAAKMWDIGEELKSSVQKKSIVKVEGVIKSYRNRKELSIQRMRLIHDEDQVNVTELLTKEGLSREGLWQELRMYMDEVESGPLRSILVQLYSQKEFREKITTYPASQYGHHAYYAGMLEHLVELCHTAAQLFPLYNDLNRNVVLASCLLHNIGLTKMFNDAIAPSLTEEGEKIGLVSLSYEIILDAVKDAGISSTDHEIIALKHCIISQYGPVENGWGSSISPKSAEALFFHHIKELSSKMSMKNDI